MLLSSFISGKGLHPLLDSTADLIRFNRAKIPDLTLLEVEPELTSIYKKVDGEDLFIVNELHQARGFRKLHLELAHIGPDLEILHCVFFPDPRYDLPIFGVDLVAISSTISAAIVDLSPVGESLPLAIEDALQKISRIGFTCKRELPDWGCIFSPYVCFIKPENKQEEKQFLEIVESYLDSLISYALYLEPETSHSPITIERYKRQEFYCLQQKRNDKTRNVLAKTFNMEWADRYIDYVLFDCPPLSQ